jgi:predicted ATP-dependent endonuclease of OLD family
MKLLSFNIQNYRSIINSGWSYLAYDNITALIGQNESGKTSVLEALRSYYEGKISDDVLRSDLTFPTVSCSFDLENRKMFDLLNPRLLPEQLKKILEDKKEITVSRIWNEDKSSRLKIIDEDVLQFYETREKEKAELEKRVRKEIEKVLEKVEGTLKDMELAEHDMLEAKEQLNGWYQKRDEVKKTHRRAKKNDEKILVQQELESTQKICLKKEEEFNKKVKAYEEIKMQIQEISEKSGICKSCTEIIDRLKQAEEDLKKISAALKDAEHIYEICSSDKERKAAYQKLQSVKFEHSESVKRYHELQEESSLRKVVAAKVFDGQKFKIAEEEAIIERAKEKKYYKIEDIGNELFRHIPVFEFFEDFSSLLPNKIDLEDLLTENHSAEGYKAAQNFLRIAGLDAEFFREKNHRILKQKIENLNGEITINFQDYWRQNVGKDNKIRLNFELEHYDYTVPEKSGKPYLEFWIKDKQERLYPKQRSRGVRWFLSFYLELKATARQNTVNRVLLIDEPGLSLHARAQEDVLKVFEDLKDKMQIVYSTHSPHLVDINKLYRILAVQRINENVETSATIILDAKSLHSASLDTLSPIYSLMGTRLNEQQFIQKKNNILIEDAVTYYYLTTVSKLLDFNDAFFIPASNVSNIPVLVNIMIGWKLDFIIMLTDNTEAKKVADDIKRNIFINSEEYSKDKVFILNGYSIIEELFSVIDFKKYILHKRVGITESISEYIETNNLSRSILASEFIRHIQDEEIRFSDFDSDTRRNFKMIFDKLRTYMK